MNSILYKKYIVYLIVLNLLALSGLSHASEALEKVSLQLDSKYQFKFAGFIMAKEKGFYKDAGLDVELLEYQPGVDIIENVLSKKNNYGIYNSSVVIDKGKIKPTVLMATYFQQSPLVFVTSKEIKHPKDLIGKKVMGTKDELKYSSLALMLKHFNINKKNTQFLTHSFNIADFIQKKVDAITVFRTNELFDLNQHNIEFNIIDSADYGISINAVNLFTSTSEALAHPDRTLKFIHASNKGWAYALAYPDEAISTIYHQYSKQKSLEALAFEAKETKKMMLLGFFNIGETNKELSLRTVKQFKTNGLLAATESLGYFIFEDVVREFNQNIYFTNKQKRYLQNKKEITMCVDPDWMPFESIKNGNHIGITADIIKHFKQRLPIPIKLIQTKDWQESVIKAKSRQCDIYSLAANTPERTEYMNFTSPYIDLPIVLATKMGTLFIKDIAEVKNKKLGIVKGYAIAELLRTRLPGINIVDVNSITEGLSQVESGALFGYIDNLMVIANSIQKDFTGILKVSSRLEDNIRLAIGTRNDQPQLNQIFEVLVNSISDTELQAIYNKWVAVKQEQLFDYTLIWKVLISILILSVGYFYFYVKLRKLNNKLLVLSTTDKLTGLYNRVKTDAVLIEKKIDVDRYETDLCIILFDIDFFKDINDRYGHITGDKVLIEFSQILSRNIRATDYAGRWGGEEFLIISPNISITEATELANKLLHKIRKHTFPYIGSMTASAGVNQFSKQLSIHDTLQNVDKALYQSKNNGRNQATAYKDHLEQSLPWTL